MDLPLENPELSSGLESDPESSSMFDVKYIHGRDQINHRRGYFVPDNNYLDLPETITFPPDLLSQPPQQIVKFAKRFGLRIPLKAFTVETFEEMLTLFMNLGYRQIPGQLVAPRPIRIYPSPSTAKQLAFQPDLELPPTIPQSVFRTVASLREFITQHDLKKLISTSQNKPELIKALSDFLISVGYELDPQRNFVRSSPYISRGGYTYSGLFSPAEIIRVLTDPTQIRVRPEDLRILNVDQTTFLSRLTIVRWHSLDDIADELSLIYQTGDESISPQLIKVALVLDYLAHIPHLRLWDILRAMGTSLNQRRQEMIFIYSLLRPRYDLVVRSLQPRSEFKVGPPPSTLTLEKAIEQGYSIDPDQYQSQFKDLLNYSDLPPEYLSTLADLFQNYPESFKLARELKQNPHTLNYQIIKSYYDYDEDKRVNEVELMYGYIVNYPLVISLSPEVLARRTQLKALPRSYLEAIYRIYDKSTLDQVLQKEVHPLELYVLALHQAKLKDIRALVAGVGMLIPEHTFNRDIRQYVLNNIPNYDEIITRPDDTPAITRAVITQPASVAQLEFTLRKYSDFEIIEHFGYSGGFENRAMLIQNIYRMMTEDGFFLLKAYDPNVVMNRTTTLLTPLEDLSSPFLAYGSPFSYRIVELDELIHAFSIEDNLVVFHRLTGPQTYTATEVTRLQTILPSIKTTRPELSALVDQLQEVIQRGIGETLRRSREVQAFIDSLGTADVQTQQLVRDIFYQVFYAGMYMRKWLGPGNKYPTLTFETRGSFSAEPKSLLALGEVSHSLTQLEETNPELAKLLRKIKTISYRDNANIIFETDRLFSIIGNIGKGTYCIRTGSTKLIITSYLYLTLCFKEIIPDFDPTNIDAVS